MQKAKDSLVSFRDRARGSVREIALALALTLVAAGFMVAALQPSSGSDRAARPDQAARQ